MPAANHLAPPSTPPASPPRPRSRGAAPEVTAYLRYLRMSPRKVRLVAQTVEQKPALAAIDYLKLLRKDAAVPVSKLIASAVANAAHNFQLPSADLVVKQILVNQGPTLQRFRPRAFGRAGAIRRRSCHVMVTLVTGHGRATGASATGSPPSAAAPLPTLTLAGVKRGPSLGTPADRSQTPGRGEGRRPGRGFTRKLFQRKAG